MAGRDGKRMVLKWAMLMNTQVPPDIKPAWSKYAISLWYPRLQVKGNRIHVPFECYANRLILILREVKNHYSAQNCPTLSSELLTMQDLNFPHFFPLFFPLLLRELFHIGPQTPKGLWNESIRHSLKGTVCHYPYNLGGLDSLDIPDTDKSLQARVVQIGSVYKPKHKKIAILFWAMCSHQALTGHTFCQGHQLTLRASSRPKASSVHLI